MCCSRANELCASPGLLSLLAVAPASVVNMPPPFLLSSFAFNTDCTGRVMPATMQVGWQISRKDFCMMLLYSPDAKIKNTLGGSLWEISMSYRVSARRGQGLRSRFLYQAGIQPYLCQLHHESEVDPPSGRTSLELPMKVVREA